MISEASQKISSLEWMLVLLVLCLIFVSLVMRWPEHDSRVRLGCLLWSGFFLGYRMHMRSQQWLGWTVLFLAAVALIAGEVWL